MTSNPSVNLYAQGVGTASSGQFPSSPVIQTRAPAATDITGSFGHYPVGQNWINISASTVFYLVGYSSLGGQVTAMWVEIT